MGLRESPFGPNGIDVYYLKESSELPKKQLRTADIQRRLQVLDLKYLVAHPT